MTKSILITARNPEETRVAILEDNELIDYDSELLGKKPIKGNVYLARVVRVEPSLQAVFIEYGGDKNGFLAFSEIHSDYYRIPAEDTQPEEDEDEILEYPEKMDDVANTSSHEDVDHFAYPDLGNFFPNDPDSAPSSATSPSNSSQEKNPHKKEKKRHYSVQEVIHHRQVLLVQAIKDVRGNKCAAFTTYLSLPGQYCVLMPNAGERSGGISRRVHEDETRQRLKDVLKDMEVPEKMSVIIRTAGQERTKTEIRRDYEYLMRLWDSIRAKTLESKAPLLIHEEVDILMRVVRDFYQKDVDEILVDTPEAYKQVRVFMKQLSPSGVKKVKQYKDQNVSLFNSVNLESQIVAMVSPRVPLASGGSLVIGQTEALVAIDVNSGKATKERHIDSTALKTNLEAAKEIAKQLRLRDLSGLIVIDFIDMWDNKHVKQVEKCFRAELDSDRARIQTGNISQFGLLEMSRQRLRSSVMETYSERCPHCQGRGILYSQAYFVSTVLNLLEKAAEEAKSLKVYVPKVISDVLLNKKRRELINIEQMHQCIVTVLADTNLSDEDFRIDDGHGEVETISLGKAYSGLDKEKSAKHQEQNRKIMHQKKEGKQTKGLNKTDKAAENGVDKTDAGNVAENAAAGKSVIDKGATKANEHVKFAVQDRDAAHKKDAERDRGPTQKRDASQDISTSQNQENTPKEGAASKKEGKNKRNRYENNDTSRRGNTNERTAVNERTAATNEGATKDTVERNKNNADEKVSTKRGDNKGNAGEKNSYEIWEFPEIQMNENVESFAILTKDDAPDARADTGPTSDGGFQKLIDENQHVFYTKRNRSPYNLRQRDNFRHKNKDNRHHDKRVNALRVNERQEGMSVRGEDAGEAEPREREHDNREESRVVEIKTNREESRVDLEADRVVNLEADRDVNLEADRDVNLEASRKADRDVNRRTNRVEDRDENRVASFDAYRDAAKESYDAENVPNLLNPNASTGKRRRNSTRRRQGREFQPKQDDDSGGGGQKDNSQTGGNSDMPDNPFKSSDVPDTPFKTSSLSYEHNMIMPPYQQSDGYKQMIRNVLNKIAPWKK
jgi:ribonuclease E